MIELHHTQNQLNTVWSGGARPACYRHGVDMHAESQAEMLTPVHWHAPADPEPQRTIRKLKEYELIADSLAELAKQAIGDREDLIQELLTSFRREKDLTLALDTERESKATLTAIIKTQEIELLARKFEVEELNQEIANLKTQLATKATPPTTTPIPAQPAAGDVEDLYLLRDGMNEIRKIAYDNGVKKSGLGLSHDLKHYLKEEINANKYRAMYSDAIRRATDAENENVQFRRQLGLGTDIRNHKTQPQVS